ncbi:MAG: DUF5615 family PIN-like protein [Parvularculaceae bacterium]
MHFLVDAQLPLRLADWVRSKGHGAQHVTEAMGFRTSDRSIVDAATSGGAVIVTKDSDFMGLVDRPPPQILWVRIGNATNRVLIQRIEMEWADVVRKLEANEAVVELG